MFIEAISMVHVLAAPGHEDDIGGQLQRFVSGLVPTPHCCHYAVVRSYREPGMWLISSHWQTRAAMEAHFNEPALSTLVDLLATRTVQRISFDSFFNQTSLAQA